MGTNALIFEAMWQLEKDGDWERGVVSLGIRDFITLYHVKSDIKIVFSTEEWEELVAFIKKEKREMEKREMEAKDAASDS